ncbi:MAG: adenylate/guanylate cyclase domain-containing protein, partial [Chromatiales bacterium]|nr:adenylate/guanylate cyclase domain-containing protein [Chromatiales bacterium]
AASLYSSNHIAYLSFSLAIGSLQQLRLLCPSFSSPYMVIENIIRTTIPMVMYVLLEFRIDHYGGLFDFISNPSHTFIIVVIPLLGIIVGFSNANLEKTMQMLRSTSLQLKQYSEWLLGKELLEKAVSNPQSLSLARQERAILFMDIRGFTHWSEDRTPEEVVSMVNHYYEAAEPVWQQFHALKVKLTADEVMLVFADTSKALQAALALQEATSPMLDAHGLSAGAGIHYGPVVEGLMGGSERKSYDLLGDSVNTAKRLCDNAAGGELLASEIVASSTGFVFAQSRAISVKGKSDSITVAPLLGLATEY